MPTFQYAPDLLTRYPNLHGGVILASGMTNTPTPAALQERYTAEQEAVKTQIGSTPLSEIPALSAWRDAFRRFGVEPTKYRSAPESLLRRLTKKGDIPFINTFVDIGNLVSIRYALPVAVFDTATIQGAVTVRFADGSERYLPLGEAEIEHPEVGEVVFVDEGNHVHARRWCWRQSDQSAAQLDTTNAIITVEAQHADGDKDVRAAVQDLAALLKEFAGGTFASDVLSADQPMIRDACYGTTTSLPCPLLCWRGSAPTGDHNVPVVVMTPRRQCVFDARRSVPRPEGSGLETRCILKAICNGWSLAR